MRFVSPGETDRKSRGVRNDEETSRLSLVSKSAFGGERGKGGGTRAKMRCTREKKRKEKGERSRKVRIIDVRGEKGRERDENGRERG